jgi:hypothetical protein
MGVTRGRWKAYIYQTPCLIHEANTHTKAARAVQTRHNPRRGRSLWDKYTVNGTLVKSWHRSHCLWSRSCPDMSGIRRDFVMSIVGRLKTVGEGRLGRIFSVVLNDSLTSAESHASPPNASADGGISPDWTQGQEPAAVRFELEVRGPPGHCSGEDNPAPQPPPRPE